MMAAMEAIGQEYQHGRGYLCNSRASFGILLSNELLLKMEISLLEYQAEAE